VRLLIERRRPVAVPTKGRSPLIDAAAPGAHEAIVITCSICCPHSP
jgi:hypothetical protein